MSAFQTQLRVEARYDVIVNLTLLALLFGGMIFLPRSAFWFYWLPIVAFYLRYTFVRDRRDEDLLRADSLLDARNGTARCYRTERGICISDGAHHVLVSGHDVDAPLQLPHIAGRQ